MGIWNFFFGQPAAPNDSDLLVEAPTPPWETVHVETISMNPDLGSVHAAPEIDPFYGEDHSPPPVDPFYGDVGGW